MNLPFIKPAYDSLMRGKNLGFLTDLSFLSNTFYHTPFSYDGKPSQEQPDDVLRCQPDTHVKHANSQTPTLVPRTDVHIEHVLKKTYESSNICHSNPFADPELSQIWSEERTTDLEDSHEMVYHRKKIARKPDGIEDDTIEGENEKYIQFVLKPITYEDKSSSIIPRTTTSPLFLTIENPPNVDDDVGTPTLLRSSGVLATPKPTKQMPCPTTIRHLVISGGGEMGFSFYSALRESNKSGFWDIKNIESIYSTSVGSIFAVPMALLPHFGWDIYDDFVLKRPWHKVFDVHFGNFANSFHKKGVFTKETMHEIFKPIFNAIDLPMNITLKEFYEYTHIDLHIMTTELTQFKLIDLSYKTHPDWEVLDAVYCSSALPILFAPHYLEDYIYLDGGFISNYPINRCLEQVENHDEILGFKRKYQKPDDNSSPKINTLFDYLFYIMYTMFTKVSDLPKSIKNQVEVYNYSPTINFYKMYNTFKSYDERVILLEDGIRSWETFYENTYGNPITFEDKSSQVIP
jgi:predicted acylesterase/phospholipase RssA